MHELCDDRKFMEAESLYSEIQQWVIEKTDLTVSCQDHNDNG